MRFNIKTSKSTNFLKNLKQCFSYKGPTKPTNKPQITLVLFIDIIKYKMTGDINYQSYKLLSHTRIFKIIEKSYISNQKEEKVMKTNTIN